MRTDLTYMERNTFEVIEKVVRKKLTKEKAAIILCCSIRTMERKILVYKKEGVKGFIHKNCNKKSNKATPKVIVNKILRLKQELYCDFGYMHFWEKLVEKTQH